MKRLPHITLCLGLLCTAASVGCCLPMRLFSVQQTTAMFDPAYLAVEPLPISDMRATAAQARVLIARKSWVPALRLVQDCRNQWETFAPVMRTIYTDYAWSEKDMQQAEALWSKAVDAVQRKKTTQALRALQRLENLMRKYQVPSIKRMS